MRQRRLIGTAIVLICAMRTLCAQSSLELNTALMETTFRIQGQSGSGTTTGTGFILAVPLPNDPRNGQMVLVTAAHVLTAMTGDSIKLALRRKLASGWQIVSVPVPIRENGHPTWVKHPAADVAAMYVNLPNDLKPKAAIPINLLVSDVDLNRLEIHPGDELNVLGYPLGYGNPVGDFPVLRSGKIASYPIVPMSENAYFLLDFRVFEGNSGGPVYFVQSNRIYGGAAKIGTIQFVMGLVSEEISVTQQFQGLYENRAERYPLSLAKIVPAFYLTETLKLLPPAN
jgi:hypothetical protein